VPMKLDSSLVAANFVPNLSNYFLPSKVTAIGTIIVVIVVTLLGQYCRLAKSLEALRILMSDIECTSQEVFKWSDDEFIIDVTHSCRQFQRLVSQCCIRYYRLSSTSWHAYPVLLIRLSWAVRATSREGQALLNKIKAQGESENMQRLDWRVIAGLRKWNI
ncbi:hypothetical protein C8J56DRAFT_982518, partial [Mycena floridula]